MLGRAYLSKFYKENFHQLRNCGNGNMHVAKWIVQITWAVISTIFTNHQHLYGHKEPILITSPYHLKCFLKYKDNNQNNSTIVYLSMMNYEMWTYGFNSLLLSHHTSTKSKWNHFRTECNAAIISNIKHYEQEKWQETILTWKPMRILTMFLKPSWYENQCNR